MRKIILIIFLFIPTSACNYKLLVHKDNIYHTRTGYLVFIHWEKYFFPVKDIKGNDFFTTKIKTPGYFINFEYEAVRFYDIGEKYIVDQERLHNGKTIIVRDTVCIIPVKIGSLPSHKSFRSKKHLFDLVFRYNDKVKVLKWSGTNNEDVQSVHVILEADQMQIGRTIYDIKK